MNMKKAKEPEIYEFNWKIIGYDSGLLKIRSPNFRVSFEVTEWYMELDLSNVSNIDSIIPLRLQRVPGVGPDEVTFRIDVKVRMPENKQLVDINRIETFNEKRNFLDLEIPVQFLELQFGESDWLNSKDLSIDLIMKNPKEYPGFSEQYWESQATMKAVVEALKTLLHPTEGDPAYYDLVLNVPGKEFKLHKCVLNARWPKLMSILEIDKSPKMEKELSGIPHDMLEHFLNFAYYGDLEFMYHLPGDTDVFDLVKKFNFYRLNDQITQLSNSCESSQILQSYRTSLEMKFTNVTSNDTAMGDFRTCEIPLKPAKLPRSDKPLTSKQMEKFQQHIRFMDLRLYVDKGPLGYNWLVYSIVLGKLPEKNPVIINCKLYVVDESEVKHLLTEQNFVFDRNEQNTEIITFETAFSNGKKSTRYRHISRPVITWEELLNEQRCFMRKRLVTKPSKVLRQRKMKSLEKLSSTSVPASTSATSDTESLDWDEFEPPKESIEEKDICFRFELKLADGEYVYDIRHGPCEFEYGDYKIFRDIASMWQDKFTDIEVTSGDTSVKAHKAILAASSPGIKKLLEAKRKDLKKLSIKIQPEHLHKFIRYFYTGQMQEITFDEVDDLISVAKEYEMKCLEGLLSDERMKLKIKEYSTPDVNHTEIISC